MPTPGPRDDLSEVVFLYVVAKDAAEAAAISERLVDRRLVACSNAFPVRSVYRWNGRMRRAREVAIVMKTTQGQVRRAIRAIKDVHSYPCPAIVALPVFAGFAGYLDWVRGETGKVEMPKPLPKQTSRGRPRKPAR